MKEFLHITLKDFRHIGTSKFRDTFNYAWLLLLTGLLAAMSQVTSDQTWLVTSMALLMMAMWLLAVCHYSKQVYVIITCSGALSQAPWQRQELLLGNAYGCTPHVERRDSHRRQLTWLEWCLMHHGPWLEWCLMYHASCSLNKSIVLTCV